MLTLENLSLTSAEQKTNRMRGWMGWALLLLMLVGFLGVMMYLNIRVRADQQFSFLARSFLQRNGKSAIGGRGLRHRRSESASRRMLVSSVILWSVIVWPLIDSESLRSRRDLPRS